MYAHIAEPITATAFLNRLTEVERCVIRNANTEDRLEYLRRVEFASDLVSPEVMAEVKQTLTERYAAAGAERGFGCTWKI